MSVVTNYLLSYVFFLVSLLVGCRRKWPEEGLQAYEKLPDRIDFNFHVKPILSNRYFACHGPDQNTGKDLIPSPKADKERLLRRAMDLTGLPPTIEEMDSFLHNPDADEKVVNRLLASDSYGERMAMDRMDPARYADSHGMNTDGWRMMWLCRDKVIKAFYENMAYNEFVTWQLAGALLPNPTKGQVLT